MVAPQTRLTPTQALFWLRHRGADIERTGGRWHCTWQGRQINVDHAALCAIARRHSMRGRSTTAR